MPTDRLVEYTPVDPAEPQQSPRTLAPWLILETLPGLDPVGTVIVLTVADLARPTERAWLYATESHDTINARWLAANRPEVEAPEEEPEEAATPS